MTLALLFATTLLLVDANASNDNFKGVAASQRFVLAMALGASGDGALQVGHVALAMRRHIAAMTFVSP
jgi:hypothetical protein